MEAASPTVGELDGGGMTAGGGIVCKRVPLGEFTDAVGVDVDVAGGGGGGMDTDGGGIACPRFPLGEFVDGGGIDAGGGIEETPGDTFCVFDIRSDGGTDTLLEDFFLSFFAPSADDDDDGGEREGGGMLPSPLPTSSAVIVLWPSLFLDLWRWWW